MKQRGSILISALLIAGTALAIALSLSLIGIRGASSTARVGQKEQITQAALGAVYDASERFKREPALGDTPVDDTLTLGTITVNRHLETTGTVKRITAQASLNRATITLTADYDPVTHTLTFSL